jgi:uncharacterized protein involved in type VI secretion and phage assembly
LFALPEVDDEVLIACKHGDVEGPHVIEALWNSSQTVHLDNERGETNTRA